MSDYIQDHSIDLSCIEYRNFSDEEKAEFKRVNEGFESQAEPVLTAMVQNPELLRLPYVDFQETHDILMQANELKLIEEWLSKKLSQVKGIVDQMVAQARPISQADAEVADIYADLFDFLSAPAKKAANTRKKSKS